MKPSKTQNILAAVTIHLRAKLGEKKEKKSDDISFAAHFSFLSTLSEQQSQRVPAVERFSRAFCGSGPFWKQLDEMAAGIQPNNRVRVSACPINLRRYKYSNIQDRNIFLNSLGEEVKLDFEHSKVSACLFSVCLTHFLFYLFSTRRKQNASMRLKKTKTKTKPSGAWNFPKTLPLASPAQVAAWSVRVRRIMGSDLQPIPNFMAHFHRCISRVRDCKSAQNVNSSWLQQWTCSLSKNKAARAQLRHSVSAKQHESVFHDGAIARSAPEQMDWDPVARLARGEVGVWWGGVTLKDCWGP